MPIYEYECEKCGTHVEAFQKLNDKHLVKCRKCGGRLERLVSAPAIQFKGTGWYVTDYASKGKTSKEKGEDKTSDKQPDKKTKESSPANKTSSEASSPKNSGSD